MPRTDPSWRTALYADSIIDGFVVEVEAEGVSGIGATEALVVNLAAGDLAAQLMTGSARWSRLRVICFGVALSGRR